MFQKVARWETEKELSSVLRFSLKQNLALSSYVPVQTLLSPDP
jgi:hypothetical protein